MTSSYLTPAFEERCFPNPFVNKELKRLNLVEFKVKVRNLKAKLLKELEEKGIEASRSDPTIYTGICGIALLYYKMYGGQGRINDQVFEMIRSAEHPKRDRITFLCGMAGPLAILYKVEFFSKRNCNVTDTKLYINVLKYFFKDNKIVIFLFYFCENSILLKTKR